MNKYEITLPVLNEEQILERSVKTILSFLDSNNMDLWSLSIANNGSTDETRSIAFKLEKEFPGRIRVVSLDIRGVGAAIRESWKTSNADVVGYMDIDLATDLNYLRDVQYSFERDASIRVINGSRRLTKSRVINRKIIRNITSHGLNMILHIFLGVKFTDAMCGFKFFDRSLALNLLKSIPNIPNWFVCAELLVRAEWTGNTVHEIPVVWTDDQQSKVKIFTLSRQYLGHIKRLFFEKYGKKI